MAEVRKIDLGERSSQGFVGRVSPTMTRYFHSANLQNLEFLSTPTYRLAVTRPDMPRQMTQRYISKKCVYIYLYDLLSWDIRP